MIDAAHQSRKFTEANGFRVSSTGATAPIAAD
jgi:hypothetical protein